MLHRAENDVKRISILTSAKCVHKLTVYTMPPKKFITMRLPPDLAAWASSVNRTALVEALLVACRERRLVILPDPAPRVVNDGSDARNPILIRSTKETPCK